jgi:hypothetical protein
MLKLSCLPVAAAAMIVGTLAAQPPAQAAVTTKVGTLTCHVDSGFGFVFGSSRSLACTFTSARNGQVQHYSGDIAKFGVDIGYIQSGVIIWSVLAPTTDLGAGALSGGYVGLTADGSIGGGAGANILTGGSTHTASLQPVSIEGDEGLNVAAGIAAITLKSAS